jgi:hypothetical protein
MVVYIANRLQVGITKGIDTVFEVFKGQERVESVFKQSKYAPQKLFQFKRKIHSNPISEVAHIENFRQNVSFSR